MTKKPKKDKKQFYVDPEEFRTAIAKFYTTGKFENYLGDCINKIAKGLSYDSKFRDYSYIEEMVGDAVIKMYAALKNKNFRVDSPSNPFSYFTTIAFRAFINRIKKEKRRNETENNYRDLIYEQQMTESAGGQIYVRTVDDEENFYND